MATGHLGFVQPCHTVKLYSGFLADFDHYQETSLRGSDLKRCFQEAQAHWSERRDFVGEGQTAVKRLKGQCYNCQELGILLSQDCPKPKVNRCRRCVQTGHIASTCQGGVESTSTCTQVMDFNTTVRLINPNSNGYKRIACGANGKHILAYLDTGSEFNIINLACVQRM